MSAPRTILVALLLSSVLVGVSGGQKPAAKPIPAKWRAVAANIQNILSGPPCDEGTIRAAPIEAADFAGQSFALVDVCPLGAYTELMTVMQLKDNKPVAVRFRKHGKQIGKELAQGASVMHGRNAKLVPEKRAIYDIAWDNNGGDASRTAELESCTVNVYVWNSGSQSFDFDSAQTKQTTASYCHQLKQRAH